MLPESRKIGLRIEQPIDVVDPESFDLVGGEHREDPRVGVHEDWGKLHPQAGQVVNVEKPPIVDLVLRNPEEGDAPMLRLDQPIELAPVAIEGFDTPLDGLERVRVLARQLREVRLEAAGPLGNLRAPVRKVEKAIADPVEDFGRAPEDHRIGQRTDRQLVGVVSPHGEGPGFRVELERELSCAQRLAILLAEHRREQLAAPCSSHAPTSRCRTSRRSGTPGPIPGRRARAGCRRRLRPCGSAPYRG